MSDATRCGKCHYVYWTSWRENWGTCPNCNTNNDFFKSSTGPKIVDSDKIFTIDNPNIRVQGTDFGNVKHCKK